VQNGKGQFKVNLTSHGFPTIQIISSIIILDSFSKKTNYDFSQFSSYKMLFLEQSKSTNEWSITYNTQK